MSDSVPKPDVLPGDIMPGEGPLDERLHSQTAMVLWKEIEIHFARGVVIHVASQLDLVNIACEFVNNKPDRIKKLMTAGQVGVLDDDTAASWAEDQPVIWAVVAAPWILVQQNEPAKLYPRKSEQ
ncbi:MAG: DUF2288 domain-containing protein [Gammaproteobacteria bacterium]|nr:DUF2288 domain-containing protein [Gammaproteobacteria bacterium]